MHADAPQLELGVEPDAVPRARRFAASVLSGLPSDVVGDAELIVTELVTNALLYAGPPVMLRVLPSGGAVRLEVTDHSRVLPLRAMERVDAMTGRGLALVENLASRTGVEPLSDGKVVWCELSRDSAGAARRPPDEPELEIDIDALLAAWPDEEASAERRFTIELGEVPTDLLVAAKAHVDNLVREFALVSSGAASGTTTEVPPHLAELIETVVHRFAEARQALKRLAQSAARRGDERTALTLTLPLSAAEAGEDYLAALDEVDAYARAARMLTLESPPQHRVFRRWYVQALVRQLRAAARGEVATAESFEARLLHEIGELAGARIVADRATRLQSVTAALATVATPEGVARIGVAEGVAVLRASGGSFVVPSGDGGFHLLSSVGYPDTLVRRLNEASADAELPGAVALRTGESIWLESLSERDERFPQLRGVEPAAVAMCVVPLITAGECLGALRFSFAEPRLFDEAERGFVTALAAQTAQALARSRLYDAERQARTAAEALADRLARLQQLTAGLAGSRETAEVVDLVVDNAADALGAGVAVISLIEGDELRMLRIRGVDDEAVRPWQRSPLAAELPANEAARTGEIVLVPTAAEFERRYPLMAGTTDGDPRSFVCVPLKVDRRRLGALSLTFDEDHDIEDPAELGFITALADACAQALDRIAVLDQVRQARERLKFLADASEILSRSLDYRTTLGTIARLLVPAFADFCSVSILDDGEYDTVAIAHQDPQRRAEAEELVRQVPTTADTPTGVPEVIRTGVSEFVPSITPDMLRIAPVAPAMVDQALAWGVTSSVTVPMTGRSGTFGALQLLYADSGRHYTQQDLELIEDLARRAAVAVENARAFEARPAG